MGRIKSTHSSTCFWKIKWNTRYTGNSRNDERYDEISLGGTTDEVFNAPVYHDRSISFFILPIFNID